MRLTLKLLVAHWRRRWLRTILAIASLSASVAMVIVVVGGHDVMVSQAQIASEQASGALGEFDLIVLAGSPSTVEESRRHFGASPPLEPFNNAMIEWFTNHNDIDNLIEFSETRVEACPPGQIYRQAAWVPGELLGVSLLTTDADEAPYQVVAGSWITGSEGIVVDAQHLGRLSGRTARGGPGRSRGNRLAQDLNNAPGRDFQILSDTGRHMVKIAGVIRGPGSQRNLQAMYADPNTWKRITGTEPRINRVHIDLSRGTSPEDFADVVYEASVRLGQPVYIETTEDIARQAAGWSMMMGQRRSGNAGFFPLLRNAGMNLAILAALFMVFGTLNMGLIERTRQLAMLRAIGMTRGGMISLIAIEAFMLALVGYLVGTAAGFWIMHGTIARTASLAGQGVSLHKVLWLGLGALTAFGATFAAMVVPAYLAARRRPLEGMRPVLSAHSGRVPKHTILLGLALIASNPVVTMTDLLGEPARTTIGLPVSCLAAIVGFALIMPALVVICEKIFAPLASRVTGLDRRLLSRQLSASMWRTVGCATAMMVALGLYLTIQIWGQSMLRPFLVTQRSPDAVVTIKPDGIPPDKTEQVRTIPGVQKVVPMILQHPQLANLPPHVRVGGIFSRTVIFAGVDPEEMFGQTDGMIKASFVRGNASDAYKMLESGNACIITDSLYTRAPEQYDVGKTIVLDTSADDTPSHISYTIAGVIEMPGWQLLTKASQMRRGMERVGAMVIVPRAQALRVYPSSNYKTIWFDLDPQTPAKSLEEPVLAIVNPSGEVGRYYARVTDTRAMTGAILRRANGIIESMMIYPFMALGLSTLAVAAAMISSIRVRSWEMGIYRSLGMTRLNLLAIVLSTGLLIAMLACTVSMLFALLVAWTGIHVSSSFWGVSASLVIPWSRVAIGLVGAVMLCLVASFWPAMVIALRRPSVLLQQGRGYE